MKKLLAIVLAMIMLVSFAACGNTENPSEETSETSVDEQSEAEKDNNQEYYEKTETKDDTETYSNTSFTNKYGTSTTKCAHSGCNNYIASSGDTNCCTTHSQRCLECYCYIDEDALYCMSCLNEAANKASYNDSTDDSYSSQHECYICGTMSSSGETIGSYWYCSSCAEIMHALGY